MKIAIDDEDSLSERLLNKEKGLINIAVICFPRLSNFTDFSAFEHVKGVKVYYAKTVSELEEADMVILPGSKNTISDLKWIRQNGMEAEIKKLAVDHPIFGICGGYQMLGKMIYDPEHIEEGGSIRGMELLDVETTLMQDKVRTQVTGTLKQLEGIFKDLSGQKLKGYEIHMGETHHGKEVKRLTSLQVKKNRSEKEYQKLDGAFLDNVYGSYVHGIFDSGDVAYLIVSALACKKGIILEVDNHETYQVFRESQYDYLADIIRKYMNIDDIYKMLSEAVI